MLKRICASRGLNGPEPGSTDNVRVQAECGPGSHDSNQRFIEDFGLSWVIFFRKGKAICICAHPIPVTQSGSGNKSH
jgi:hypothetical protein